MKFIKLQSWHQCCFVNWYLIRWISTPVSRAGLAGQAFPPLTKLSTHLFNRGAHGNGCENQECTPVHESRRSSPDGLSGFRIGRCHCLVALFFVLAGQRMDSEDIVRSLENTAQLTILTNYSAPVWLAFHHQYEKCGCIICRAEVRLEFLFFIMRIHQ